MDRYSSLQVADGQITEPMIEIKYPVVIGNTPIITQNRINQVTRRTVVKMISEQQHAWAQELLPQISGTYEVMLNQSGTFSIKLENYGFPTGAAHGLTIARSQTFDACTGYVYSLCDLFRCGVNYKAILSNIIEHQIDSEQIPTIAPFPGISSRQEYFLTPTDLVIFYQAYEFTPGSVGICYFFIPFEEIKRIVCPDGPITRLMKDK